MKKPKQLKEWFKRYFWIVALIAGGILGFYISAKLYSMRGNDYRICIAMSLMFFGLAGFVYVLPDSLCGGVMTAKNQGRKQSTNKEEAMSE